MVGIARSLKLPDDLLTQLEGEAKARRVTKSSLVRESLEKALRRDPSGNRFPFCKNTHMRFTLRRAVPEDTPALAELIQRSVRELQRFDYSSEQIEAALEGVFGVDSRLIADGTYFAVTPADAANLIVGCGGWSRRSTLYGGDQWSKREDSLIDPRYSPAKIRAFFVHPDWSRRGIGSLLLRECEAAALKEGFTRLEMGATLTGVALYAAHGYAERERTEVPLGNGIVLPVVFMEKTISLQEKRRLPIRPEV
jgi:GNAT superfamily N-acetyltransferase